MINEQREAIKRLEKRIKDNEDYKTTQVWLTDDVVATQTVLSLIKEQQEEIKRIRYIKRSFDYVLQKETDKKDKQIDLMADLIYEISKVYPGTVFHELTSNGFDLSKCDGKCQENFKTCKDCIKQYFEQKATNNG
jgi:hypothetical protein